MSTYLTEEEKKLIEAEFEGLIRTHDVLMVNRIDLEHDDWPEIKDFLFTTIDSILEKKIGEIEKLAENYPQVDHNFNDGGDDEYRDRRVAIESRKRSAYLEAIRQSLSILKGGQDK